LLTFIGAMSSLIAAEGEPAVDRFALAIIAIGLGSGGCNGLTNYLDREIDAHMDRTKWRALPSGRIHPAEMVLPWAGGLVAIALIIAWLLSPWAFLAGLMGVIAALIGRRSSANHFLGGAASCAPILVGWLIVAQPSLILASLCLLVFTWVLFHIWTIMLSYKEDYKRAGIYFFPINRETKEATKVLLGLCLLLLLFSIFLYFAGDWGGVYLLIALLLNLGLLFATYQLRQRPDERRAWLVYKLATYPYLGILFLTLGLTI